MHRLRGRLEDGRLAYALACALAVLLAVVALRLWRADLAYPLVYSGDSIQYLTYAKGIHDHGWMVENGRLGTPFGLFMYDWAEGGWLSLIGLRLIDLFSPSWVTSINLFYLLSYPLAALTALWAMRRLGVATPLAVALSLLYTILPFHQERGPNHLILSFYYGLPPLLSYAVTTAAGRSPIPRPDRSGGRRTWLLRAGPPVAAALLAGIMSVYYVVFAGLLMLAATAFGWLRTRRLGLALAGLAMCLLIALAAVTQYSPALAYRLANGSNHDAGARYIGEAEYYPLKPADLLLPVVGHPIRPLAELRQRYSQFNSRGQPGLAFGTFGALGLLLALGGFVAGAAGSRRTGRLSRRLRPLGWLAAAGLAIGMMGGGATLIAFAVGPYLRAWDRIAIAVAFLAFAALGVTLTHLRRRLPKHWRAVGVVGLAVVLVGAGTLDQATGAYARPYETIRQQWQNDGDFVAQIEDQLPTGAAVFQLPDIVFPESTYNSVGAIETARFYLHSADLRWSAGRIKGREPGWQAIPKASTTAQAVSLISAAGFSGVTADRLAYTDPDTGESTFEAVVADLTAQLGPPTASTADGRMAFFPMQPRPIVDAMDPVWLRWASGFGYMAQRNGRVSHATRAQAILELRNLRAESRQVVAQLVLLPNGDEPRTVELHWPDGSLETIELGKDELTHRRQVVLPAGRSQLRLVTPGAPPRSFVYTLADLVIVDPSLAHLLPALP